MLTVVCVRVWTVIHQTIVMVVVSINMNQSFILKANAPSLVDYGPYDAHARLFFSSAGVTDTVILKVCGCV